MISSKEKPGQDLSPREREERFTISQDIKISIALTLQVGK
jgi:hypothetical protein